jgi:hypothetical protein
MRVRAQKRDLLNRQRYLTSKLPLARQIVDGLTAIKAGAQ